MAAAIARVRFEGPRMPTSRAGRAALSLVVFAVVTLLVLAIGRRLSPPSVLVGVFGVVLLATTVWMFCSQRYGVTLTVLVLYLGLLDGYLKLKTGSQLATLGRDLLLYAIVLGFLSRKVLRHEPIPAPPLAALVLAFVLLAIAQVFNPGSGEFGRSVAALRPHLEFVPLFLLAYLTVTTRRRLFVLLLILVVAGSANGVVSLIQSNLTPEQLATWGPGYEDRLIGDGVAARTFEDSSGVARVRPFGLGGDSGAGGVAGLLALPSALALIAMIGKRREALLALPLVLGIGLAIITSTGRNLIIGSIAALLAYVLLTVLSRRLVPTLAGIVVSALSVALISSALTGDDGSKGALSRYESIAPGSVLKTAAEERGSSITLAPAIAAAYPLGAGLGTVGPAATFQQASENVDGETEFNFLLVELGIPGAVLLLAFFVSLLRRSVTHIRRVEDLQVRLMLAGLAAPLFAIFVLFFSGAPTSGSPAAPYIWGVAGVLAFWLNPAQRARPALARQ